ncbi:MAG: ribosomal RNA small subunit methyltransferase A [Clostridia bacterium]|nr:ribosomal RNA small subunit methyltransferase A [Clostridia bacterium]
MDKTQKQDKFFFKHSLGQNFIKDEALINGILDDAGVQEDSNVLEIGAGAGALTTNLCKKAQKGKILSIEIDKTLEKILNKKLAEFNNIHLVFDDILKVDPKMIAKEFEYKPFKVVANLPYYITTPILEYLLSNDLLITDITVMVQLEVAKRLSASVGTKDYGAITPILEMYGKPQITRIVKKEMFTPQPKVDSAVLHIQINKIKNVDIPYVSTIIKKCFSMRRKTLQNNLMNGFELSKEQAQNVLVQINKSLLVRAEELTLDDFLKLSNILKEHY